jgi:hypothetical protein
MGELLSALLPHDAPAAEALAHYAARSHTVAGKIALPFRLIREVSPSALLR